jgi:A/G-specific adenine glycosylase
MSFYDQITAWYDVNYRNLPWRQTRDPYKIWLSEVILQQTRVDQGLPYYYKFVDQFPDLQSLAHAKEDVVLRLWQGLGYYNRCRNMLATAKQISVEHNGQFPKTRDDLIKLKGVGPYTSAAIASFANDEPVVVVDGNVYRLLSRYLGLYENVSAPGAYKVFEEQAIKLLEGKQSSAFNQAMMELGGQVCKPRNPECSNCPVSMDCYAFNQHKTDELPVKAKKKKASLELIDYFVIEKGEYLLMKQRPYSGIWPRLFDFPERDTFYENLKKVGNEFYLTHAGSLIPFAKWSRVFKHLLTHRSLEIHVYYLKMSSEVALESSFKTAEFYKMREVHQLAKPQIVQKILEDLFWGNEK